jgi:hypothetical protein
MQDPTATLSVMLAHLEAATEDQVDDGASGALAQDRIETICLEAANGPAAP